MILISKLFKDDRFKIFRNYSILVPSLQKDINMHGDHFREFFPFFKANITLPSLRLGFYSNCLKNLIQSDINSKEKEELKTSLKFLEKLRQEANTEMTLNCVKNSPIDLRLGGKLLHVGELTYLGGSLNKKKFLIIAFENVLLFTINKLFYFNYQSHYRVDQLCYVDADSEGNLVIMTSDTKKQLTTHKFRSTDSIETNKWVTILQNWIDENQASYETSQEDSDLYDKIITNRMLPLCLFQVFPELKAAWDEVNSDTKIFNTEGNMFDELIIEEEKYVKKLNKLIDPETLHPPEDLAIILQRLKDFHARYFLPDLREAAERSNRSVIDTFYKGLKDLSIYQTYLEIRCWYTIVMNDGMQAFMYVAPIRHFAFYLRWARKLGNIYTKYRSISSDALQILMTYIADARVRILHDSIYDCRIDFYRTGDVLRRDKFEIKSKLRGLRNGEYIAILFENVILLTRPNPPRYQFINDIWLDQVYFGPKCENLLNFKLELRQGGDKSNVIFEFRSDKECVQREWVRLITRTLTKLANKIKKKCSLDENEYYV